jgi:hypothetical protein
MEVGGIGWPEIDAGIAFESSKSYTGVAASATEDIIIRTGANPCKLNSDFNGSAYLGLELYEGPELSDDGTEFGEINLNRASPNPTVIKTFHTPTVTDVGDEIHQSDIAGSISAGFGGDQGAGFLAWKLKPDTDYLLRVENKSAGPAEFSAELRWIDKG